MMFVLALNLIALEPATGEVELMYEPKVCIMEPCPQFRVLSINGEKAEDLEADITNVNARTSSISSFRKVRVKGEWTKEGSYLKIVADEWKAEITEKLPKK